MRKNRKSMRQFLREHAEEIDSAIRDRVPNARRFNEDERRLWVLNDEGLYLWAKQEGVNV